MSASKSTFKTKLWIPIVVLLVMALVAGIWIYKQISSPYIFNGVTVMGINMAGYTLDEAEHILLKQKDLTVGVKKLQLNAGTETYTYTLNKVGVDLDVQKMLSEAYSVGRKGHFVNRLKEINRVKKEGYPIEEIVTIDKEAIIKELNNIKAHVDNEPKNAYLKYDNQFEYFKDVKGEKLDIDENLMKVVGEIQKKGLNVHQNPIVLSVKVIEPKIKFEDINKVNTPIATFTTRFSVSNTSRAQNIKQACDSINGKVLHIGEVISLDETLGPRTEENGYEIAKVIVKSKLVEGVGGGVCQVATTLYNAALLSGMDAVERKQHSLPLDYVSPGRDATIAEGYTDLKIKNTLDYAIMFSAKVKGNELMISVYSKVPEEKRIYKLRSEVINKIKPGKTKIEIDNNIKDGVIEVEQKAKDGYRAKVYREVYSADNKLLETHMLSDDTYKAQEEILKMNTNTSKYYQEKLITLVN